MLNKQTIYALSAISGITNTVVLKHPVTIANSAAGDVIVHMNVSQFDPETFEDIGIYNLSEFLSTFKLFSDERVVKQDAGKINITDGSTDLSYITSNIALLSEYNKTDEAFTKTESVPSVAEFKITTDDIKKIKSASGIFSDLSDLCVTSQDGVITLSLTAENKFNAKSNTFNVRKSDCTTSKEFEIKLPVSNFVNVPASEYLVTVRYNSAVNAYRIMLNSTEITDFKILMAIKK